MLSAQASWPCPILYQHIVRRPSRGMACFHFNVHFAVLSLTLSSIFIRVWTKLSVPQHTNVLNLHFQPIVYFLQPAMLFLTHANLLTKRQESTELIEPRTCRSPRACSKRIFSTCSVSRTSWAFTADACSSASSEDRRCTYKTSWCLWRQPWQ